MERFPDLRKLFLELLKVYYRLARSDTVLCTLFMRIPVSWLSTIVFLSKDSSSLSFSSYLSVTPNRLRLGRLLLFPKKSWFCAIFFLKMSSSFMNCAMFLLWRLYRLWCTCIPALRFCGSELWPGCACSGGLAGAWRLYLRWDLYLFCSCNILQPYPKDNRQNNLNIGYKYKNSIITPLSTRASAISFETTHSLLLFTDTRPQWLSATLWVAVASRPSVWAKTGEWLWVDLVLPQPR